MPANRTQARLDFGKAGNWNAIEARARDFVEKWQGETYERGESQSFWSDFLQVFGIDRKRAGDHLYRPKPFEDDDRIGLLLKRYQALTADRLGWAAWECAPHKYEASANCWH